jgi:hypothetical protein
MQHKTFPQSLQANAGTVAESTPRLHPSHPFQFIIHNHLTIQCYITYIAEAMLLNKYSNCKSEEDTIPQPKGSIVEFET